MCDFRNPPDKVFIKATEQLKPLPLYGHYGSIIDIPTDKLEFGLYHIGMSGCGYRFYDGQNWSSIDTIVPVKIWDTTKYFTIDGETDKYRFIRSTPTVFTNIIISHTDGYREPK